MPWRDGAKNDSGNSQVSSLTLTIPGDVQAGDWVAFGAGAIALSSTPVSLSASSTGTAPVSACSPVTGTEGLPAALTAAIWKFQASASDAGKVITITTSGGSAFLAGALGARSGCSGVDVAQGAFGGANSAAVTCPLLASTAAGDEPMYMAFGASEGSAPNPGLSAPAEGTLTQRESDISAANIAACIYDINGQAGGAGAPLGGVTFTAASATNSLLAAFTVAFTAAAPASYSPSFAATDGNGVQTWSGTTALNQPYTYPTVTPTGIGLRILPPSAPASGYPHAFLHVLPVNAGYDDTANGNGLDVIRLAGLHNTYNLTVIEHSYGISPWYADSPQSSTSQLESFAVQVAQWAAASTLATGGERHYLIGFSKSGIGGAGLLFRHPGLFAAGAFWDAPFMMSGLNSDGTGIDSTFGSPVGGDPGDSYGNTASFQANYQLSNTNLTSWKNASNFGTVQRAWIGGHFSFGADVTAIKTALTTAGIRYDGTWDTADASHAWHTGWVTAALASIIIPAVTGAGLLGAGFP